MEGTDLSEIDHEKGVNSFWPYLGVKQSATVMYQNDLTENNFEIPLESAIIFLSSRSLSFFFHWARHSISESTMSNSPSVRDSGCLSPKVRVANKTAGCPAICMWQVFHLHL